MQISTKHIPDCDRVGRLPSSSYRITSVHLMRVLVRSSGIWLSWCAKETLAKKIASGQTPLPGDYLMKLEVCEKVVRK